MNVIQEQEPTSFKDVVGRPEWDGAMDEEMNALDNNGTWELVPLPHKVRKLLVASGFTR